MKQDILIYKALPGQVKVGQEPGELYNTEVCPIRIEGYAIPGHMDGDGHIYTAGFDIVSMTLAQTTEFASSTVAVLAQVGSALNWRQVPQAVQWADEQSRLLVQGVLL